jgi:DNA end-binding protein Ku
MAKMRDLKLRLGMIVADVEMHKASNERTSIAFKQVHQHQDGSLSQVGRLDYCKDDACPGHKGLKREEIGKGYEFKKGQFVEIDKAKLDALKAAEDGEITLTEVVPFSEIEKQPYMLTGSIYYLTPLSRAKFPPTEYRLLREIGSKVALGRICMDDRVQAVAVTADPSGCLMMYKLRFPDEVRPKPRVELPEADPGYLAIMQQIIAGMTKPEMDLSYRDDYELAKRQLVENTVAGVETTIPAPARPTVQNPDIKAVLEAMLAAQGGEKPKARAKGKKGKAA